MCSRIQVFQSASDLCLICGMRTVAVRWAGGKFAQDIEVAEHRFRSDEQVEKGGEDSGPTPHELLLAALGSCTAMTLKVYAERKGWALRDVNVTLDGANVDGGGYAINRQIRLFGELDADQRQRLVEIADKCPVHKTLIGTITITTTAGPT
jgi:putative redox protein